MKGKVFVLIILVSLCIGIVSYFGFLDKGSTIQVKTHYIEYACGDNNIDMKVSEVSNSDFKYLIGKTISPELLIKNERLKKLIKTKLQSPSAKQTSLNEFTIEGYIRQGDIAHCSGSLCFKVKKIKYEGEIEFTEF